MGCSRGAGRNGDRARNSERVLSYESEVMIQGCWQPMQDPGPCQNALHLLVATGRRNVNQGLNRLSTTSLTGPNTLQWASRSPREGQGVAKGIAQRKSHREMLPSTFTPAKVEIWVKPGLQGSAWIWCMLTIHSLFVQLSYQVVAMGRIEFCFSPHGNVRLTSEHQTRHASFGYGSCHHVIACCRSPVT